VRVALEQGFLLLARRAHLRFQLRDVVLILRDQSVAIGALLLERPVAEHSGELAQSLNFLASGRPAHAYPFDLDVRSDPWKTDLRPCVRAIVEDLLAGRARAEIADRFHATLVAAGCAAVRVASESLASARRLADAQRPSVVLGGGCFQNPILLDGFERALGGEFEVLRPRAVPPGDGGLALGQALVADALAAVGKEI
jgi:hydrogenase maturation protein HypF